MIEIEKLYGTAKSEGEVRAGIKSLWAIFLGTKKVRLKARTLVLLLISAPQGRIFNLGYGVVAESQRLQMQPVRYNVFLISDRTSIMCAIFAFVLC